METKDKRILVTGATGQQGGAVARHLLQRGFQILALTRQPDKMAARELERQGAELVRGDLNQSASLKHPLQGAYGVYSVQNWSENGIDGEIKEGKNLADMALDAGVRHFVYSSVAGADMQTGIPFFDSKWTIEQHIRQIDIPYTIVRPAFFMENWFNYYRNPIMEGKLPLPLDPDRRLQMIALDDIGGIVEMCFENPEEWLGREVDLAGDERTPEQLAETFSHLIGRSVRHIQVPWDQFEKMAGEEMTRMYRWLNDVSPTIDIERLRREYPHLHTLEDVLRSEDWRLRMTA